MDRWDFTEAARFGFLGATVVVLIACLLFACAAILYSRFRGPGGGRSLLTTLWSLRWIAPLIFVLPFPG